MTELLKQQSQHTSFSRQAQQLFDCKICKTLPVGKVMVVTMCCNQLIGCHNCFMEATEPDLVCPLCRAQEVTCVPLKGFDEFVCHLDATSPNP